MISNNKYFKIIDAPNRYRFNLLSTVFVISALCLIYIYFSPLKFFLNEVINISSPNGCLLLTFTGIPCPFCGFGRVFSAITDFNFLQAIYFNPLALFFYFISALIIIILILLSLFNKKVVFTKTTLKLWYIPLLFIILMWILNIFLGNYY